MGPAFQIWQSESEPNFIIMMEKNKCFLIVLGMFLSWSIPYPSYTTLIVREKWFLFTWKIVSTRRRKLPQTTPYYQCFPAKAHPEHFGIWMSFVYHSSLGGRTYILGSAGYLSTVLKEPIERFGIWWGGFSEFKEARIYSGLDDFTKLGAISWSGISINVVFVGNKQD